MGIVAVLFAIFLGLGALDSFNPAAIRANLFIAFLFFAVTAALFFVIAKLFKKRSQNAIRLSYTYLSIGLVLSVINNFILNSPSNGLVFKLLGVAVFVYLFINTRKASKQGLQKPAI